MLQPIAENAQALLNRVVDEALAQDGGKPSSDDVAAVAVRRSH
jgi:hypothetical protein